MIRKRRRINCRCAIALVVSLMLGMLTPVTAEADTKQVTVKSKIELSSTKLTVYVGKTKKLTMENADKKTKLSARYITKKNTEDGVAAAIYKYALE